MKSSFANADQELDSVPHTSTALAAPTATEIVPDSFFANDGVEGDFDKSDVKIPRLSLVQGVGPLSALFPPGTFVYNKEIPIGTHIKAATGMIDGSEGVKLTLVRILKYFLEDLAYDESGNGPRPQYFKTMDDARRAGFLPIQDKYKLGEEGLKFVKPILDADVLIEGRPSDVAFQLDFKGVPYGLARWTLQSTAYSRVGKQFFTDSQLALKSCGLSGKFYAVSAKRENLNGKQVFVPKAVIAGRNPDDFIAFAKKVV